MALEEHNTTLLVPLSTDPTHRITARKVRHLVALLYVNALNLRRCATDC